MITQETANKLLDGVKSKHEEKKTELVNFLKSFRDFYACEMYRTDDAKDKAKFQAYRKATEAAEAII